MIFVLDSFMAVSYRFSAGFLVLLVSVCCSDYLRNKLLQKNRHILTFHLCSKRSMPPHRQVIAGRISVFENTGRSIHEVYGYQSSPMWCSDRSFDIGRSASARRSSCH